MTSITCRPIVNTGFSEVIGSWKIMLISLPRTFRISVPRQLEQVAALEPDLAADDAPGGIGDEPQDAQRGDALARPGLADEPEHLAGHDVEVDAIDGLGDTGFGEEVGPEAPDSRRVPCSSGSRRHRKPASTPSDRRPRARLRR